MTTLLWFFLWVGGLTALAYHRATVLSATIAIGAGLILTTYLHPFSWLTLALMWVIFGGLTFFANQPDYRRKLIVEPIFEAMSKSVPRMSDTEKVALEAGTVSWEGELFAGHPQWEKLLTIPSPKLSDEEQAFLDGPARQVCEMVNDWEITHYTYDLPKEVWLFLKENGFFALMIPKKYGGKGFSEFAHSEILTLLSSRCLTLSSTVAVPNSLGPAELLLRYGTAEQRDYYLPRLASGDDLPCFALTGPEAGSDAGSLTDFGVVCRKTINGKDQLGITLNWNKRYITLAPIATLLGLAFKLYDPDKLLGDKIEYGITCALVPTDTPGITIGRRHLPSNVPFQNGPTQGKDVFIPIDGIIGGPSMAGNGWRMLVECLSTGRAISLPSSGVGGMEMAALTTGAYSLIRRQFHTSLSNFEGVQEPLARIGGFTYMSNAVRRLTVSMIDAGERPSVPGAIAKYHTTELARRVSTDAMDIHGGKGIMLGPNNYLASSYHGAPIGITVEGANILTRNMIIFGQGAVRCHPYLLKEMQALEHRNLYDFEHYLGEHIRYSLSNAARAFFHGLTASVFVSSPVSHAAKPYFQQLSRASSAFALVSDACLALLGGKLKFKEAISARLGDLLSMMYLLSAILKQFQDRGAPDSERALLRWSADYCLAQYWHTMYELLHNLPNRPLAFALRVLVMPLGIPRHMPKDSLNREITAILTTSGKARQSLIENVFISTQKTDPIALLEQAFAETTEHAELLKKIYSSIKNHERISTLKQSIEAGLEAKIITPKEAEILHKIDKLSQAVIAVDDFSPVDLGRAF
jgi:acyl-CoA dehydrogenase